MTEPEQWPQGDQLGPDAEWPDVLIGPDDGSVMASGVAVIDPADIELMGTTPKGLPYPESTDPLNQGANAIKALALAVDAQWTAGKGSPTGDASGRASFAHGLGVTPRVVVVGSCMLTPDGDNAIDVLSRVSFSKADATNITVRFYDIRGNGAVFAANPVGVSWVAFK
jgi:hypothetical protein